VADERGELATLDGEPQPALLADESREPATLGGEPQPASVADEGVETVTRAGEPRPALVAGEGGEAVTGAGEPRPAAVADVRGEAATLGGEPQSSRVVEQGGPVADRRAGGISVVELVDVTEEAKRFGFACRVLMFPALAERIPPARVLGRLRDLLIATVGDPGTAALAGLALTGQKPPPRRASVRSYQDLGQFLQRARAGLGGTLDDGSTLAFHVGDGDGIVPILCALSAQDTAIELSAIDDVVPARWEPLAALLEEEGGSELAERRLQLLVRARAVPIALPRPKLFLLHDGKRYTITQDEFVIGRGQTAADLTIRDGMVSRRHAAVIRRAGSYYLKDLGSIHGVIYKGMRIDNKRIDEGDVFDLAGHEIAFTFHED
jgi:hypothetical protein